MTSTPAMVSTIIPTYNRGAVVGEAVESVLGQTYQHAELIVVDDASTDDTRARMRRLDDPRVRYLRYERNRGVGAARNTGAAMSTGSILAFLDSDDLWKPDKLEATVDFFERHPEIEAVFTDLEKVDGAEVTSSFVREAPVFSRRLGQGRYPDGLVLGQREMFLCLLQEVPVKPTAFAIRRTAFERLRGFDEAWISSQDWELFLRLSETSPFGYIDRPLSVQRLMGDALHRRQRVRGLTMTLELFRILQKRYADDPEALAAMENGITVTTKHLCWDYVAHGRRGAAFRTYLRSFEQNHDTGLLARALAVLLPDPAIEATKRLLRIA